ncbi:MAG: hypothetical protein BGO82_02660 [Devosia sp. 67-54]|uniref:TetR/AcrR family transcriptional regulator n=1 Tax=unclassified Devosia TaxID=196773 RepID=UPI0008687A2A|nr:MULTISPECIES: TetR/AcrR family transcriptional regulator [unclassified Devosia]MBN9305369.1 TetR/AcrR family transcriptional regulator [Devosia sp.]ODU62140.1 MAG: hypothetical protein ABT13_01530 [Pelagibacterium sp. SCN 68-10]OJX18963.1 MAG: hypothetical protein BGO82_02660 [Devosia sp. 67-54]
MARPFKIDEHSARRNEILDAALGLVLSKGYERMTVADISGELGISSGAFYHYFGSKPGLLDAIVERMRAVSEPLLAAVVNDAALGAIAKLQGFLDALDAIRLERRALVVELLRIWQSDDNAIVRARLETSTLGWRAELVTQIVRQGVAEGVFSPAHPKRCGEIVMALLQAMGNAHATEMLCFGGGKTGEPEFTEAVVAIHDAYLDAVERVLAAPARSLRRTDAEAVRDWSRLLKPGRR